MRIISEAELELLLDNINRNMKDYDDDISLKMEQSDKVELSYMKVKKTSKRAYTRQYAKFNIFDEE